MSIEILFKAKRKNWEKLPREEWWVEGYYVYDHCKNIHLILRNELSTCLNAGSKPNRRDWILEPYEIDPETLFQYTGLPDKNGKKIWENDVLVEKHKGIVTVKYRAVFDLEEGAWMLETKSGARYGIGAVNQRNYEVIGNIFDNPELLKE